LRVFFARVTCLSLSAGGERLLTELSAEGLDLSALSPSDVTSHVRTLLQTARVKYVHMYPPRPPLCDKACVEATPESVLSPCLTSQLALSAPAVAVCVHQGLCYYD